MREEELLRLGLRYVSDVLFTNKLKIKIFNFPKFVGEEKLLSHWRKGMLGITSTKILEIIK